MKPIQVTAAIIFNGGKILLAQRQKGIHMGGKWEFPGGKLEEGESPQDCLKRELIEELDVVCEIDDLFCENTFDYGDRIIHLITYKATIIKGVPKPIVHSQLAWVLPADLRKYDMPEADLPILEKLMSWA